MRATVIGTLAFVRAELVATLRQPRLLLMLVLGPFLVLLVFGMGYQGDLPALSTVVVGGDSQLTQQVDDFVQEEEPSGIDYRGTTDDRDAALRMLRSGTVDLVVVLPDRALDTIGQNERATIEVHERSLDPITSSQIYVAADSAVAQINDRVLEQVVTETQDRTAEFTDEVDTARQQLEDIRSRVSDDDLATAQRGAAQLADRLDAVADGLDGGGVAIAQALGLGDRAGELQQLLRDGASQLEDLAAIDAPATLADTADALDELDSALSELQSVDPQIAVRPFKADVVSDTPVSMTLDRFYAPGLVALMLQHVALTFAALALVRERRRGTTELLAVAPVSLGERLAGKAIAFLLLGGTVAVALTALIVGVFGVPVPTDWGPFLGLIALTLLASLGYGFLVAAASDTESQAVQFSMLFLLAAIFFTGLFLPLDRMGMPAVVVTWLTPATYAFAGLQRLMLLQQGVRVELFIGLALIALATTGLAGTWLSLRQRRTVT